MRKERILIVEGQPDISSLLKIYFTAQGYEVFTAMRGQIALEICNKTPPNLALLDVNLPDMEGYDIGKALRASPRTRHIPIIFLTARGERRDRLIGLGEVMAQYYIIKPFDIEEVHTIVRNLLKDAQRKSQMHPATSLPTTGLIDEAIRDLLYSMDWAVAGLHINGFEAFMQSYGSVPSEDVLTFTALLLTEICNDVSGSMYFIGQLGVGPDFVIISSLGQITAICERLIIRFDEEVGLHYNYKHRKQRFIEVPDDAGNLCQYPLMSLSGGVISWEDGPFCDTREIRDAVDAVTSVCRYECKSLSGTIRSRYLLSGYLRSSQKNPLLGRYSALAEIVGSADHDLALLYLSITGGERQTRELFQSHSLSIPHAIRVLPVGRGDVLAAVPITYVDQIEEDLFNAFETHPLVVTATEPPPRMTVAWAHVSDTSPGKLLEAVAQNLIDRYRSQGIVVKSEPPLLQIQPGRFGLYDRYCSELAQVGKLRNEIEQNTGEVAIRKVIRQLTAIIDHDLRNGLRALSETFDVALDDQTLIEDERKHIDAMQQAIQGCRAVQQHINALGENTAPVSVMAAKESEITTILPLEDLQAALQSVIDERADLSQKLRGSSDARIMRAATETLTPLVSQLMERIDEIRRWAIQIQQPAQPLPNASTDLPHSEVGWRQKIRRSVLYCYLLTRNLVLTLEGERLPDALISINDVIDQVLDMLAASSQHLQMVRHLGSDLPTVKMAVIEMQQVLMNLIRNAIDATESGEIEVTSARVQSKVVVQIRDTGCGIPQKNAFAIFLLNFSTKVSGSVSGVGLYAVKSLIERAGGAVFVSSACQAEANQIENWQQGTVLLNLPAWDAPGTIFQISLPCA